MGLVDKHMVDKDIRRLIYVFLKSGVMTNGCMMATALGTPQGGPLSPLLSNIYLTPYDRELEDRGLRFVRYADDCNIFTKSRRPSFRVRDNAKSYLERKMKLSMNMEKTEARRASGSPFLGFTFLTYGRQEKLGMVIPHKKKLKKLEDRIRLITSRNRGVKIDTVIGELNNLFRGWFGCFARSSMKTYLEHLSEWTRRRIRQYLWKLGSNSYWKMSGAIGYLLGNNLIREDFGLIDVLAFYKKLHAKRMESDRVVLDYRYHSLFG